MMSRNSCQLTATWSPILATTTTVITITTAAATIMMITVAATITITTVAATTMIITVAGTITTAARGTAAVGTRSARAVAMSAIQAIQAVKAGTRSSSRLWRSRTGRNRWLIGSRRCGGCCVPGMCWIGLSSMRSSTTARGCRGPVGPFGRTCLHRDRVRIRFVHAAVTETHVFHLHLYEWHALPSDPTSPRIDAISISPQTGHTIEPVWGAGNRHQVAGDVIWHCHLYPHFHEGMWGIFRTFETRQDGEDGSDLDSADCVYAGRRIGRYPDGTRISKLLPLPGNAPPGPTADRPGFPLYIPGRIRQKSPRPPWPDREFTEQECQDSNYRPPCEVVSLRGLDMPPDFDYQPFPTDLERLAFNELPVPGEMFTRNRIAKQQQTWEPQKLARNNSGEVCHNLVVSQRRIDYNDHGWHDRHGHLYHLEADGDPAERPGPDEPLFFRAQHGQIVNMTLRNALPQTIEETEFDHAFPPCPALPWEGECAPHVHMVKFDPICADGASVGWNYMSGARIGRKMVYRWWADQEFGTIFFHDHLFANYRQKHGLFGALIVEPAGSKFFHHLEPDQEIVSGLQALRSPTASRPTAFVGSGSATT